KMRILKLTAENFMKLTAVEISPTGNVVQITGKNAAGKSSVLDAIEATLCGGRNLPKKPIRDGEESATVITEIGEEGEPDVPLYKVTRRFFGATSRLTVETVGGARSEVKSPQTFLDGIVGNLSFDPLAFSKLPPTEQRTTVMEFLGLNLEEYDTKILTLKNRRSDVRKDKERRQHDADAITSTVGLPPQELSSETLLAELKVIQTYNEKRQETLADRAVYTNELQSCDKDIAAAKKAIADWQSRLSVLQDARLRVVKALASNPEVKPKDTAEVEIKLKSLEETNKAIRLNETKQLALVDVQKHTNAYADLGAEIKIVEKNKAKKMAESVMPVRGLAIQSDGLSFEGIPLEQVNSAKQLEVCVAVSMVMNPKLKVLRINGNDLDNESLLAIGRLADNQGYQIWVEKVSDDSTVGFFIEEGHLASETQMNTAINPITPVLDGGLSVELTNNENQ
ncbi:MAG: AAA family ATPase, partial [Candidatus Peribacteraceae bacterium]|nr:AAA family ATPase [Candidatus Peribacteraceae bacterium]